MDSEAGGKDPDRGGVSFSSDIAPSLKETMNTPHSLQTARPLTKLSALMLVTLVTLAAALAGPFMSNADASTTACYQGSSSKVCMINEPDVQHFLTSYPGTYLYAGQHVTVQAGGCYQSGGSGKTWKRFVDPISANSNPNMFKGYISIPGTVGAMPLMYAQNQTYTVGQSGPVSVGVYDSNYGDNGYWGRSGDDGTYNQCLGYPNAWVQLIIKN